MKIVIFSRMAENTQKWTTRGWSLCVKWKDGSTSWVPLKDLKEGNTIELAEYAEANHLLQEPAFAWWAPGALRRRRCIIKAVAARHSHYHKRYEKFGQELPKTVKHALEIDHTTGTDFWRQAIIKEMGSIDPCIDLIPEGKDPPPGYEFIRTNIVFDIKMDFTWKARFMADGSMTEVPSEFTFASVMSRNSVWLALLYVALNNLDILSADMAAAYLNAPAGEKALFPMKCGIWKFGWSLCPPYQGTVQAEDQCRSMAEPPCSCTRTENGLYCWIIMTSRRRIFVVPRNRTRITRMCVLWVRRKISTSQKLAVGVKTTTRILAKILAKTMVKPSIPNEPMKNTEKNLNEPMKNQENKHQ